MTQFQQRRLFLSAILALTLPRPGFADDGVSPLNAPVEEVPYVQTPPLVVRRMLQLAEVTPRDVVWDLGSGDGRIVIAAATQFGARGVGYEIDPTLVAESRALARRAGVASRAKFMGKDLFGLAFGEPSVVTLYLLPEFNMKLRSLLLAQMRPGSRVVSHEWDMGDWRPDETLLLPSPEKPHGTNREHRVMLWVIPAAVAGTWKMEVTAKDLPTAASFQDVLSFELAQRIQEVTARPSRGKVLWVTLRGTLLSMAWTDGTQRLAFRGNVLRDQWRGEIQHIGSWANTSSERGQRFFARRIA